MYVHVHVLGGRGVKREEWQMEEKRWENEMEEGKVIGWQRETNRYYLSLPPSLPPFPHLFLLPSISPLR